MLTTLAALAMLAMLAAAVRCSRLQRCWGGASSLWHPAFPQCGNGCVSKRTDKSREERRGCRNRSVTLAGSHVHSQWIGTAACQHSIALEQNSPKPNDTHQSRFHAHGEVEVHEVGDNSSRCHAAQLCCVVAQRVLVLRDAEFGTAAGCERHERLRDATGHDFKFEPAGRRSGMGKRLLAMSSPISSALSCHTNGE